MTITQEKTSWYQIDAKADVADVYIFDAIDPAWGMAASDFVKELNAVKAPEINVHLNSPGGNVFDGMAILNALRNHPSKITTVVDGLAASIASVIAMGGDEVVMSRNSQLMIHNASGAAIGDAKTMRELADVLERQSDNIASVYAERAGGDVGEWRAAMGAETWYSAQEAVTAGLADRITEKPAPAEATNRFDLSIFNHAGRDAAPKPYMPAPKTPVTAVEAIHRIHNAPVKGADTHKEGDVQFSDEQLTALRSKLGLADDAPLEPSQVLAAISAPGSAPQDKKDEPDVPAEKPAPKGVGTMTIDASAWDEREERIKKLEASAAKHARDERDQVIDTAVRDGKFAPARKEHWARLWDADPEGTREVLGSLQKNVLNVQEQGFAVDDESIDAEFAHLFPKGA